MQASAIVETSAVERGCDLQAQGNGISAAKGNGPLLLNYDDCCVPASCDLAGEIWERRGRDSNPRYGYPHTPLAGERLQPLSHLSKGANLSHRS